MLPPDGVGPGRRRGRQSRSRWYKLVGDTGEIVSIEHYGESADDKTLFREFGFTPEAVVGRRGAHRIDN